MTRLRRERHGQPTLLLIIGAAAVGALAGGIASGVDVLVKNPDLATSHAHAISAVYATAS
jgi:hypothetical protein